MIRVVLLVLFFLSFVDASFVKKVEVIETSDRSLSIDDIKDSKDFKRTKLPFIRHSYNVFFLKVTFDKEVLAKDKIYSLELDTEFNAISLDDDVKYINVYKNKVIDQSYDDFTETIYVKVHNVDQYVNFDVQLYDANDYASLQILQSKLFGLAYGIIFAAFLYYLALYIFNREKSYIYYSLTQLSMLSILLFLAYKEIEDDRLYMDLIFFFFFLFSNLFTKSFLNTKVNTPIIHKLLTLSVVLYVADIFSGWLFGYYFIADNMPLSALLVLYLIAGVIVYNQGYKPALFYLIAWGTVILSFLFIEGQFYFTENAILIKPAYVIHTITPFESLVLAFALSYKMKLLQDEKQQQQQFLTHQSKLASMGEMIGNIAHQWRQPLTHLSYIMMNLKTAYDKDRLTSKYFEEKSKEANEQLEYMSNTIDDFRDFFKMSKQKEKFLVNEAIDEVINLQKASFKAHRIEVMFEYKKEVEIETYRGEFLQVLFNLLNNAKDEFIKKQKDDGKIFINLKTIGCSTIIEVLDNAGGIPKDIIDKIFEPYFTTKDKGLGLGLYMSKMIIDRSINGKLEVQNQKEGALFTITI